MIGLLARRSMKQAGLVPQNAVTVRRNVKIKAADGVDLLTDIYLPRGRQAGPVVLIRSPYGRLPFGISAGYPFASQGYFAVVQSCRGTADSGGTFDPHHDEHDDGLATIAWIKAQPFFDGDILTYGPSYLGYTQWAVARDAGAVVKAMAMQVTLSDFSQMTYAGDGMMLQNALSWTHSTELMKHPLGMLRIVGQQITGRSLISDAQWRHLPLSHLDEHVIGKQVPFWQDWTTHASSRDPWWDSMRFHDTIPDIQAPISLFAGWHDIFAPWTFRDFKALQAAGKPARITAGPWTHTDQEMGALALQEALDWFGHHLGHKPTERSAPVKLYVVNDGWRTFQTWPPAASQPVRWHLQAEGGLACAPPDAAGTTAYRYDPADPTPAVGGPTLKPGPCSVDNRALEARSDVRCFTSAPLEADLDVIGSPAAELFVRSTAQSADFFVRLCDVDPAGVSRNICDGLQRVTLDAGGGVQRVRFELWPTAHRFQRGHRLRVQVSSGAFPRWARNLGTGEPLGSGSAMVVADQTLHHGPDHPAALILPTIG